MAGGPTDILIKIFDEIEIVDEKMLETNFDSIVFEYVDEFLAQHESDNYPELIYENSKDISALKIGSLLDICLWSSRDNGKKQINEQRIWFRGSVKRKIEIVLNVSNIFPLNEYEELIKRLGEIRIEHPELTELCDHWAASSEQLKN